MNNLFHESGAFGDEANKIDKTEDSRRRELISGSVNELEDKFKSFVAEARKFKKDSKKTERGDMNKEDQLKENPVEYAKQMMYDMMLVDPLKRIDLGLGEAKFKKLKGDLQVKEESLDKALKEFENDKEDLPKIDEERLRLDAEFHKKMEEFNQNKPKELPFIISTDLFNPETVIFDRLSERIKLINSRVKDSENYIKKINKEITEENREEKIGEIEQIENKIAKWREEVPVINSFWERFPEISKEFNLINEKLGDKERTCACLKENIDFNEKKIVELNENIKELKKELIEIREKITNAMAWEEFTKLHEKNWQGQWKENKKEKA